MDKTVVVEKVVDVEVPVTIEYVRCYDCGDMLDYDVFADEFGGLQITVAKCGCTKSAIYRTPFTLTLNCRQTTSH